MSGHCMDVNSHGYDPFCLALQSPVSIAGIVFKGHWPVIYSLSQCSLTLLQEFTFERIIH